MEIGKVFREHKKLLLIVGIAAVVVVTLGMVMRAHDGNVADQHLCLAPGLAGFLGSIDRSWLESMR